MPFHMGDREFFVEDGVRWIPPEAFVDLVKTIDVLREELGFGDLKLDAEIIYGEDWEKRVALFEGTMSQWEEMHNDN